MITWYAGDIYQRALYCTRKPSPPDFVVSAGRGYRVQHRSGLWGLSKMTTRCILG